LTTETKNANASQTLSKARQIFRVKILYVHYLGDFSFFADFWVGVLETRLVAVEVRLLLDAPDDVLGVLAGRPRARDDEDDVDRRLVFVDAAAWRDVAVAWRVLDWLLFLFKLFDKRAVFAAALRDGDGDGNDRRLVLVDDTALPESLVLVLVEPDVLLARDDDDDDDDDDDWRFLLERSLDL